MEQEDAQAVVVGATSSMEMSVSRVEGNDIHEVGRVFLSMASSREAASEKRVSFRWISTLKKVIMSAWRRKGRLRCRTFPRQAKGRASGRAASESSGGHDWLACSTSADCC